jgi:hypothetical protein
MPNQNTGDGAGNFSSALWSAFLSYLYQQGKIDVPADFRTRISAICNVSIAASPTIARTAALKL